MLRRRLTIAGSLVAVVGLIAYLSVLVPFQTFKHRTQRDLAAGGSVAVTAAGRVEYAIEGTGPTVMVLPGSFGGYDQARLIGSYLVPLGFRILAVSRPGYLGTPIGVGRTPREQAEAFVGLIDALGLGRVGLLAGSGGGPAALELAAQYPTRIWSLVLVSTLTGPKVQPPAPAPVGRSLTDAVFGDGFSTWRQLRRLERSGVAALESPIFSPATKAEFARRPDKLARFFELAWFRFPPALRSDGYLNDRARFGEFSFEDFERIRAPTLVVHGTSDLNAPIENGDRAASRIDGAEYLRLDGADHYLSIALAEVIWPQIAAFLGRGAPSE